MSIFRTILEPQKADFSVTHQDHILNMGSCFAQHIGFRLKRLKFSAELSPFGILYNPMSIGNGLKYLLSDDSFGQKDIFQHQDLWHSFAHHGQFSHSDPEKALAKMNESLEKGRTQLKRANRILITLGTAQLFHHKASDQVVANCHKLPSEDFEEKRLSIEEICDILTPIFKSLHANNPDLKIIISVSPVRHLRDGFIDNQRSKASLLLALQLMSEEMSFVNYFPAYELLMDDLRDYRFYEEDMMHPSNEAIKYIYEYFSDCFFDDATKALEKRIDKVLNASQHRPLHPESPQHQTFVQTQLTLIDNLEKEHGFLNFSEERSLFEKQIVS